MLVPPAGGGGAGRWAYDWDTEEDAGVGRGREREMVSGVGRALRTVPTNVLAVPLATRQIDWIRQVLREGCLDGCR